MANRTDEMADASVKARTSKKKATKKQAKKPTKKAAKKPAKKTNKKKEPVKKKTAGKAKPRARARDGARAKGATAVQREVRLSVERQFTSMGEVTDTKAEDQKIDVRVFATEPAVVTLKYGLTLNFGNYEGCRLDVGLSLPCYLEERDAAYEEASRWVSERIEKERDEIRQHKQKLFTV